MRKSPDFDSQENGARRTENKSSLRFPSFTNLIKTHKGVDMSSKTPFKTRDVVDTSPSLTAVASEVVNRCLLPFCAEMKSAAKNHRGAGSGGLEQALTSYLAGTLASACT